MKNPFTEHPRQIGENYFTHLRFALYFGVNLLMAGIACVIHAVFPFIFTHTGSNILLRLTRQVVARSAKLEPKVEQLGTLIQEKSRQQSITS